MWVRFVLVPGLTDAPDIASGIAAFAASLGNVERVEVLPFHQLGKFKWERLGLEYTLARRSGTHAAGCGAGMSNLPCRRPESILTIVAIRFSAAR